MHRFEKGNVIVELDDAEAVLPKSEQIPQERFRQGETIRAYLLEVEKGSANPSIVLSRAAAGFVKRLFELEVPEISQGIVEIKSLSREAGERTKIAVYSKEERIDPVGACVGMRGSRVRDIVKELHGERIDIVRWHDDIREYLPAAVSPAEITKMAIDRSNKSIVLTVPKDQLSMLIGKKGRNIRLASKLIGWELIAEVEEDPALTVPLSEVPGISDKKRKVLETAGFETVQKLLKADMEELSALEGIGVKTAEKILAAGREELEKRKEEKKKEDRVKEEQLKEAEKQKEEARAEEEASKETEESEEEVPAVEEGAGNDKEDAEDDAAAEDEEDPESGEGTDA
ncbi:MAG: transcription termination factor NusA [Candidatus Omnitrophica bacterium]|nr:transcription termination factor NusA [Candidatus Omnitrophota bacterium]